MQAARVLVYAFGLVLVAGSVWVAFREGGARPGTLSAMAVAMLLLVVGVAVMAVAASAGRAPRAQRRGRLRTLAEAHDARERQVERAVDRSERGR